MKQKAKVKAFVFYCHEDEHLAEIAIRRVEANNIKPIRMNDTKHIGIVAMERKALNMCKKGEWAWFVHADIWADSNCLEELLKLAKDGVGAVEACVFNPSSRDSHDELDENLEDYHINECKEDTSYIHTACTLIRGGLKLKNDYFPPDDFETSHDDNWISVSMHEDGWKLKHAGKAFATHLASVSDRKANIFRRIFRKFKGDDNRKRFKEEWEKRRCKK